MYMLKVTIATTSTPQRVIPKGPIIDNSNTAFQQAIFQNNGAANMYLGDSSVSATNGILIYPSGGSVNGTQPIAQVADLKDFWVVGTAADVLNIMVFP